MNIFKLLALLCVSAFIYFYMEVLAVNMHLYASALFALGSLGGFMLMGLATALQPRKENCNKLDIISTSGALLICVSLFMWVLSGFVMLNPAIDEAYSISFIFSEFFYMFRFAIYTIWIGIYSYCLLSIIFAQSAKVIANGIDFKFRSASDTDNTD